MQTQTLDKLDPMQRLTEANIKESQSHAASARNSLKQTVDRNKMKRNTATGLNSSYDNMKLIGSEPSGSGGFQQLESLISLRSILIKFLGQYLIPLYKRERTS